MAIFQNFLTGFNAGQQQRQQQDRQNALLSAGDRAARGNWNEGAGDLFRAGMINEGLAFQGEGRATQARTLRQNVGSQIAAGNMTGATTAAAQAGDLDMWQTLSQQAAQMDDRQRAQAAEGFQQLANLAGLPQLRGAPPEQRGALALQLIQQTPYATPQVVQAIERAAMDGHIDDAELDTFQQIMMTAAQQMQMQQTQQGIALDRELGRLVQQGVTGAAAERAIAAMPGGGEAAFNMRGQRAEAERRASALTASSRPSGGRPLPERDQLRLQQGLVAGATNMRGLAQRTQLVTDAIGQARQLAGTGETGLFGAAASLIPGTRAHDLARVIDTIEANIGFNELNQMRQSSPTGAALGSVTERELTLLSSVLGSLSQAQSQEQFLQALETVETQYARVLQSMQQDYEMDQALAAEYGLGLPGQGAQRPAQGGSQPGQRRRYNPATGGFE